MKLVKLVYLAHGWHLGLTEVPLILDKVQAWKYGPVIPSLYHQYKAFGGKHIDDTGMTAVPPIEDEETEQFLDIIWENYSKFTGGELSTLTHEKGSPWWTTWNLHGGAEKRGAIIPEALIQEYYLAEAAK